MSLEIAWRQNILVTDSNLLKLLLVVLGFGSLDSADKTFVVYTIANEFLGAYCPNIICTEIIS